MSLAAALAGVQQRIAGACRACGRAPDSVNLVAVAKTHPADSVAALLAAGQRHFGENRVQEAAAKYPALKAAWPDLRLHLIGPLQSNKLDAALEVFDVIETLDRPRLAEALASRQAAGRALPALYIQVNTGAEPQKAGVLPGDADGFIARCRQDWRLPVRGLMCIPPAGGDPVPHFQALRSLAERAGLPDLSMGMSGDFELGIRCGATLVRVGSAIFGARAQPSGAT